MEETAGALPFTTIKGGRVHIVLSLERGFKTRELNPFWLLRVPFCLGNLINHTRIHDRTLLQILQPLRTHMTSIQYAFLQRSFFPTLRLKGMRRYAYMIIASIACSNQSSFQCYKYLQINLRFTMQHNEGANKRGELSQSGP
jgi:hypothetical protein